MAFTAIAVVPPFVINRVSEISADWSIYRNTRSASEAFHDMLPESLRTSLFALGLFVWLPLVIAAAHAWGSSRKSPRGSNS